jgi:hypothetical protein
MSHLTLAPAPERRRSNFIPAGGMDRLLPTDQIPVGWLSIRYWFRPGSDVFMEYSGPVLRESKHEITIEVFGERMLPMLKSRCTITRPVVAA